MEIFFCSFLKKSIYINKKKNITVYGHMLSYICLTKNKKRETI